MDIANLALSPGVNNPTTAVQALEEIHSLLLLWDVSPTTQVAVYDSDGTVLVIHQPQTFTEALHLGAGEIWHDGKDSPAVAERVKSMFDDLSDHILPVYRVNA